MYYYTYKLLLDLRKTARESKHGITDINTEQIEDISKLVEYLADKEIEDILKEDW